MTTDRKPSISTGYKLFSVVCAIVLLIFITKHIFEMYAILDLRTKEVSLRESQLFYDIVNEAESNASNKEMFSAIVKDKLKNVDIGFLLLDSNLKPFISSDPDLFLSYNQKHKILSQNLHDLEGAINQQSLPFRYYKQIPKFSCTLLMTGSLSKIENVIIKSFFVSSIMMACFFVILFIFYLRYIFPFKILSKDILADVGESRIRYPRNIRYQEMSDISDAFREMENAIANEKLMASKMRVEMEVMKKECNELEQKSLKRVSDVNINVEFLNNLSHEIRTPLQGISAISKGLIENWSNFDSETNYNLAVKIANNTQRLMSLVGNLLDVSKHRSGGIKLKFKRTNLVNLVQEMIDEERSLLDQDGLILEMDSKVSSNTHVLVDPDKIMQVLRNLLGNAVKVTTRGKIRAEIITIPDEYVQVSIIDEGIGVPKKELESIFMPFTQSSRTKGTLTGVGLGLSISQEIVVAHGGKIWAENNVSRGAKFSFTLPLPQNLKDTTPTQEGSDAPKDSMRPVNIVIIDDEETCLLSLSMMLYKTNYVLHQYTSPVEGLAFIENNHDKVDIILLDMMMPELDGIEVLEKLKSKPNLKNIDVIMQSGVADESQMEKSWDMGIKDFLRKPYTKEALIASMENALKHKNNGTTS